MLTALVSLAVIFGSTEAPSGCRAWDEWNAAADTAYSKNEITALKGAIADGCEAFANELDFADRGVANRRFWARWFEANKKAFTQKRINYLFSAFANGIEISGASMDSSRFLKIVSLLDGRSSAKIPNEVVDTSKVGDDWRDLCDHYERMRISYDKFEDVTSFTSPAIIISNGVTLTVFLSSSGKPRKPSPEYASVVFRSVSSDAIYSNNRSVIFLLDDSVRIPVEAGYKCELERTPAPGRITVIEYLGVKVPFQFLSRMSRARSISIKIGPNGFDIPFHSVAQIGCFASAFE